MGKEGGVENSSEDSELLKQKTIKGRKSVDGRSPAVRESTEGKKHNRQAKTSEEWNPDIIPPDRIVDW